MTDEKIKYLVIGGEIMSKNDGDIHYVNALKLCQLYGVDPNECRLLEQNSEEVIFKGIDLSKYEKVLRPRYDGNNNLT